MRFKKAFLMFAAGFLAFPAPAIADTLRIATRGDLNLLDPHTLNETFTIGILGNVMEGLTRRDKNLRIIPGLATSWQLVTPTRWRFNLRKDVRFHDGSPFTADDVIFSLTRARRPGSQMRVRIPPDAEFARIDEHTVEVLLERPDPIMHYDWDNLYIMSKAWAARHGMNEPHLATANAAAPSALLANGTGPFRIVTHRPGERTVFERNPDWWDAAGHNIARVVLTPIQAPSTRTAALVSGQVDVIVPAPIDQLERLRRTPRARIEHATELRTIFINLDSFRDNLKYGNLKDKNPFKDIRVRKAIYHAIDVAAIRKYIMRGFSQPASLLISEKLFALAHEFDRHPFDLETAKRLIGDAGYANGFRVTMDCPNDRYVNDEAICTAVSHMLAKIGIHVDVRAVPKARFFQRVTATSGYDSSMNLLGWTPGTMDGLEILTYLAGCRDEAGNGALFNLGGYCNPEIDRLAGRIRVETDMGTRNRLLADAFRIIHDEAGIIPLHQQMILWGVSRDVRVAIRADNQIRFDLMRLPERSADAEH
jgi:peptide/nickel transport system substrate-binding protein